MHWIWSLLHSLNEYFNSISSFFSTNYFSMKIGIPTYFIGDCSLFLSKYLFFLCRQYFPDQIVHLFRRISECLLIVRNIWNNNSCLIYRYNYTELFFGSSLAHFLWDYATSKHDKKGINYSVFDISYYISYTLSNFDACSNLHS